MKAILYNTVNVFDGFFYFFGFISNPAGDKLDEIMSDTPAEKIKKDLKKIRKDYSRAYQMMHEQGHFMPPNNILHN
jgi:hypothetical protein